MSTDIEPPVSENAGLHERKVTINQLVGYNMARYRRAARLTQEELGKRLGGWSKVAVSAAERSWEGKRVRKFDADELVTLARALGVPVIALFLSPADAGTARRYILDGPGFPDLATLLLDVLSAPDGDSPAMTAYRERLMALGLKDPEAILADARERASSLEADAQERHRQAMGTLVQQLEELERRVDDLRAFEREYHSRLEAFLDGQLRYLRAGVVGSIQAGGTSVTRSVARAGM
jgi:transcriptional regulator with XRE-family HTH domain